MYRSTLWTCLGILVAGTMALHPARGATPKVFPPPGPTAWEPVGCRVAPADDPVLGTGWRNLHADAVSSDELDVALVPMFDEGWLAEAGTFNVTGPVFDEAGNLYFAPLYPYENVVLISVEPVSGARRWAIAGTGATPGTSAPMVLDDPASPGDQIVYLAVYDRAIAVHSDGSLVWDVPTGLTLPLVDPELAQVFGINYVPALDAIAGLTVDGMIFLLDRASGAQLLAAPHSLPGSPSPEGDGGVPPNIEAGVRAELAQFMDLPPGQGLGVLLGEGVEVANHFSVDPLTGRLWVAATAPDAEDGTVDGVSEFGALFGLDLVPDGPGYQVVEACHRYFAGGSASTPALRRDGSRVYVGDADGLLIALENDCSEAWSRDIGAQIIGSAAVASDNGEVYVTTLSEIVQVIDEGATSRVGWNVTPDVFDLGLLEQQGNLNLVSIGANGVSFQAGAGRSAQAPQQVGAGVLDRETGAVRYFTGAFDETVAVMSAGPDGALYLGNSPFRRAIARVLFPLATPPLVGGVRQYAPLHLDLLIDDAVCGAASRVDNAADLTGVCSESVLADIDQTHVLIAQSRAAAPGAIAAGDLDPAEWAVIEGWLTLTEAQLDPATLDLAAASLEAACIGAPPPQTPSLGPVGLAVLGLVLLGTGALAPRGRRSRG